MSTAATVAAPAAAKQGHSAADNGAADKLLGIELLRFASALAVLVFHFQHFVFVGLTGPGFVAVEQPFYQPLKVLYTYGFHGVQVFWCISGFIFFWKYGNTIADKRIGGREFFVLRLSRLYPLHIATLLLVAIGQYAYRSQVGEFFKYPVNDFYHFVLQIFMASNWTSQIESFNGPIWSISIEVLVYALFFVGLRFLTASVFGLAAIFVPAMIVIGLKLSDHPFFHCVQFFYTGCFVALVYGWTRSSPLWRSVVSLLCLLALVGGTVAVARGMIRPLQYVFVASPALIFLCVSHVRIGGKLGDAVAVAGNMTYASYLLHVPLQIAVCLGLFLAGIAVPWRSPVFFVGFLLVTLALSHLCYTFFEMPAQKAMRRRLLGSRKSPSKVAASS